MGTDQSLSTCRYNGALPGFNVITARPIFMHMVDGITPWPYVVQCEDSLLPRKRRGTPLDYRGAHYPYT